MGCRMSTASTSCHWAGGKGRAHLGCPRVCKSSAELNPAGPSSLGHAARTADAVDVLLPHLTWAAVTECATPVPPQAGRDPNLRVPSHRTLHWPEPSRCGCPQLRGALRLHSPNGPRHPNPRERQEPWQVFWPYPPAVLFWYQQKELFQSNCLHPVGVRGNDSGTTVIVAQKLLETLRADRRELAAYKVPPAVGHTHPDPQLSQLHGKAHVCIFRIWGTAVLPISLLAWKAQVILHKRLCWESAGGFKLHSWAHCCLRSPWLLCWV